MKERLQLVERARARIIRSLCFRRKKDNAATDSHKLRSDPGRRDNRGLINSLGPTDHLGFRNYLGFRDHLGFSLLEVMVALTLTGLIMMAVLTLFYNNYSIYRHSMDRGGAESKAQVIYRRISDIIGSAYGYPFHDDKIPCLQGETVSFKLYTDRENGLRLEEVIITNRRLVYKSEDFRYPENKREDLLFTGIDGEFSYLDESTGTWRSEWSENTYPALIRLDLRVSEPNKPPAPGEGNFGEAIPPLVFPIMVEREY